MDNYSALFAVKSSFDRLTSFLNNRSTVSSRKNKLVAFTSQIYVKATPIFDVYYKDNLCEHLHTNIASPEFPCNIYICCKQQEMIRQKYLAGFTPRSINSRLWQWCINFWAAVEPLNVVALSSPRDGSSQLDTAWVMNLGSISWCSAPSTRQV